ncbi:CGNR zinc finger domain-containing protein [Kribbella sp. CA-293567]|uniref:CGNR zinc finger domain-containing protein n=1 Tax=Kribbella sp. CA-293567 TaxID=3002436 RepID=UPI0022DD42F4|nr:CGNR zinc finger domain-containing protein [Kribbella sp. CA-293567]WBQ03860.1 CGNR zinc finger domain-containing protein [Kribbella sp. CA-293567]
MRVQVEPMPLDALVELVNGWGVEPRRAGARSEVPPLADHVHRAGVPASVADTLTDTALIQFADTIFGIFTSVGTAARVDAVSGLLRTIDVRPDLAVTDGEVRRTWWVDPHDALLAAALLALRAQLCDENPGRLGVCIDGGCADIYVDGSPAGRRRFCSVTCQNRARAAKYRRTRRSAS